MTNSFSLAEAQASLKEARTLRRPDRRIRSALDHFAAALAYIESLMPQQPAARLDHIPRHWHAKRAIEVALVGEHSLTLIAVGNREDAGALVAATNAYRPGLARLTLPCPCGNHGSGARTCICTPAAVATHRRQATIGAALSADIVVEIASLGAIPGPRDAETDETILQRVNAAQQRQVEATISDPAAQSLLQAAVRQLDLSGVRISRVIAVAQSIARLAGSTQVRPAHLAEAFHYRPRW